MLAPRHWLFALTLPVALACGGGSDLVVEVPASDGEKPQPPDELLRAPGGVHVPAYPKVATGLCKIDETPRFSCDVKGGKTVSVCEDAGTLVYRFGKLGALELQLPADVKQATPTASRQRIGEDSEQVVYRFFNDNYSYAAVVDRTEGQFEGRVLVRQGRKLVATLPCGGDVAGDLTELDEHMRAGVRTRENLIGSWSDGESELVLDGAGIGLAIVEGSAVWTGANPGQIHTGEVAGPLNMQGESWVYDVDGCELVLQIEEADKLDVSETGSCGGLNVTFRGTYRREP